ncbi:MAG: hypothetical protein ABS81_05770 [Pseudonocardia sp. SCN 72-86]|nr:MAG: hypothetical protein ABS81_05770 [Pseudonocardia sp. SCN 72-86]
MGMTFGSLVDGADWVPMPLGQQGNPSYFWKDGGMLGDAPVDFAATFGESMDVTTKPIDVPRFNRNPLRVEAGFTVPRHEHGCDEMIFVFQGEYHIEHGYPDDVVVTRVGPGDFFLSRAGTPYTMTAGPEGVTYIETWPVPVRELTTSWHDFGWVPR